MSWTIPEDVTDAWIGDDAPGDDTKVQLWIDKAERELRRRVPDLQARIDAEAELVPPSEELLETAKDVVVAMVTRIFRNPTGTRQKNATVTTGPFSETTSETVGGNSPGVLEPTSDELAKLSGLSESGAFTVDLLPSTSPFSGATYDPLWWVTN